MKQILLFLKRLFSKKSTKQSPAVESEIIVPPQEPPQDPRQDPSIVEKPFPKKQLPTPDLRRQDNIHPETFKDVVAKALKNTHD